MMVGGTEGDLAVSQPAGPHLVDLMISRNSEARLIRPGSRCTARLFEVEVHHADPGTSYTLADWPDWFVSEHLYRVTRDLAGHDAQAIVLTDTGAGRQYFPRADGAADRTVTGPGHELPAWLLGRGTGPGLSAEPAGSLPQIPPY